MSIVRIQKRENPYAQIDKTCLDDISLSWKAKGVLTYLLSKPDKWKVNIDDLKNKSTDGRDAIYSALKELRDAGYAELVNSFDENNKLLGKEWIIHETAISGKSRNGKIPNRENPDISNNDINSNNELSAESEKDSAYGFDEFWQDYAFKRGSKRKACERFGKLTGRDRDEIKRTLPYYLRSTTTDRINDHKGEFKPMRKYPEFYLSARLWESQADELAEQMERDETPTEWDGAYMEYLQWVKERYPRLLHDTKHMSKAQYIEYKTTYYITGKSRLGDDLERKYMIRSHEQMNMSDGTRREYHDVFALHCEKVKEFIKSQPV